MRKDPFDDPRPSQSMDDLNGNPFSDSHDKYLEPDDDGATPHASTVSLPYHQQAEQYSSSSSSAAPATRGSAGLGLGAAGVTSSSSGDNETASRMEEIRRREAELAQREAALGQREEFIRRHGRNNWPPRPFWPFRPLLYHDIEAEIPQESRQIVSSLYKLWLAFVVTTVLNFVACLLLLIGGADDGLQDLGGSIVDLFIGPIAFMLWYR